MNPRVIHIQPLAPAKPAEGQACNGCGVCCLAEPCPLGVLLTGRRTGACEALRWLPPVAKGTTENAEAADTRHTVGQGMDHGLGQYRCAALMDPQTVLKERLKGRTAHYFVPPLAKVLPWVARRWISAGSGCDCSLVVERGERM